MVDFTSNFVTGEPLTIEKIKESIAKIERHRVPVQKISTGSLASFQAWVNRHTEATFPMSYDERSISGYLSRPLFGIDVVEVSGMSPAQAVLTEDGIVRGVIDLYK